jgi:hypothetical protein
VNLAPAQLEWAWLSKVYFEVDPDFLREDVPKAA